MSSVSVVVPWAGACPYRLEAFSHVRAWYARNYPDWDISVGLGQEGPGWCKAEAVRNAFHRSSADILVIADADCIAPNVGDAVSAVRTGTCSWAMPHRTVHRLNQTASTLVIRDNTDPSSFPRTSLYYAQMPYTGYAGGGVVVLKRETYKNCPLDPRFTGWGQEDESWATALKCLSGTPWRPRHAPLWHLWHPPQQRSSRAVGSPASRTLRSTYRRLVHSRTAMEEHIEPARAYLSDTMAGIVDPFQSSGG